MEHRQEQTTYDSAAPRQALRYGRERGIRINIPAAELRKAGIDPHGPPPTYRVWGTGGGGVMVRLYTSR
jgi:hypothetical protein